MREHPKRVSLELSGGRWSLLVDALHRSRAEREQQLREAAAQGDEARVRFETEAVRELSELLEAINPEGEHQEIVFPGA